MRSLNFGCKHLAVIITGLISAEPARCYLAAKQATNGGIEKE